MNRAFESSGCGVCEESLTGAVVETAPVKASRFNRFQQALIFCVLKLKDLPGHQYRTLIKA